MVRKRSFRVRFHDRRRRRRRGPPPKDGWLLPQLATLVGVSPRTIRYYLEKKLIPKPEFYGTATRYPATSLLRVLAIQRMQRDDHLSLDAIKTRLAHMTDDAIKAYALENLTNGPAATALGVALPAPSAVAAFDASEPPPYASVRWDMVQLLPGLALVVRSDASALVKKLAGQIYRHCVGASSSTG